MCVNWYAHAKLRWYFIKSGGSTEVSKSAKSEKSRVWSHFLGIRGFRYGFMVGVFLRVGIDNLWSLLTSAMISVEE